jgi:hypothetical protein
MGQKLGRLTKPSNHQRPLLFKVFPPFGQGRLSGVPPGEPELDTPAEKNYRPARDYETTSSSRCFAATVVPTSRALLRAGIAGNQHYPPSWVEASTLLGQVVLGRPLQQELRSGAYVGPGAGPLRPAPGDSLLLSFPKKAMFLLAGGLNLNLTRRNAQ